MADIDILFLDGYTPGDATIIVLVPDCTVSRITKLNPAIIKNKCPLLAYAFDDGPNGDLQATIETSTAAAAIAFLRYIYTDEYPSTQEENVPCSLLTHAEVYKLAINYDIPELQVKAHLSFIREIEFSCYMPNAPIGLCGAIRVIYEHLTSRQPLLETLLNYCVSCFAYHGLKFDSEFRQVAFEIPEFHKGLCQTNCARAFEDEGASDIMQLPVCRPNPMSAGPHVDKRTHAEFQFTDCYDSASTETDSTPDEPSMKRRMTNTDLPLAFRPKRASSSDVWESEDPWGGSRFTAVYRPKAYATPKAAPPAYKDHAEDSTFEAALEDASYDDAMPASAEKERPAAAPGHMPASGAANMLPAYSETTSTLLDDHIPATVQKTLPSALDTTTRYEPIRSSMANEFDTVSNGAFQCGWDDAIDDAWDDEDLSSETDVPAPNNIPVGSPSVDQDWDHVHPSSANPSPSPSLEGTSTPKTTSVGSDDGSEWSLIE